MAGSSVEVIASEHVSCEVLPVFIYLSLLLCLGSISITIVMR